MAANRDPYNHRGYGGCLDAFIAIGSVVFIAWLLFASGGCGTHRIIPILQTGEEDTEWVQQNKQ